MWSRSATERYNSGAYARARSCSANTSRGRTSARAAREAHRLVLARPALFPDRTLADPTRARTLTHPHADPRAKHAATAAAATSVAVHTRVAARVAAFAVVVAASAAAARRVTPASRQRPSA
jgi:hypothetical protein